MKNHYKNMLRGKFGEAHGYRARHKQGWLVLEPARKEDRAALAEPCTDTQDWMKLPLFEWKFHLSIAPADTARAWNIFADLLMADKTALHLAKVAGPGGIAAQAARDDDYYAGKAIVYCPPGKADPACTIRLLTEAERRLRAAGIRPGADVPGDRKIPGALYTHYVNLVQNDSRNDRTRRDYNPAGRPDVYAGMDFTGLAPARGRGVLGWVRGAV